MASNKKSSPANKADEIKDLLLDVIGQDDGPPSVDDISQDDFDFDTQEAPIEQRPTPKVPAKPTANPNLAAFLKNVPKPPPVNTETAESADKTVRLGQPTTSQQSKAQEATIRIAKTQSPRVSATESRVSPAGNTFSNIKFQTQPQVGVNSPTEAVLKQSESLRLAQARISELENELERLREDNGQLASAGEILKRRTDELLSRGENLDSKVKEQGSIFESEKQILKGQMQAKDRDLESHRQKVEELEQKLSTQFESIRRRERELEHRLEILKMENQDILLGKDKMILELKRKIDSLNFEVHSSKEKSMEMHRQFQRKQEAMRRVIKALRIALSILEGDEETQIPLKKAE